jgi:hypothetical protein
MATHSLTDQVLEYLSIDGMTEYRPLCVVQPVLCTRVCKQQETARTWLPSADGAELTVYKYHEIVH